MLQLDSALRSAITCAPTLPAAGATGHGCRRRALDQAQAARLVRLWHLLGRVGERELGPRRQ